MKVTDSIPAEKLTIFHKAAFAIIKDCLREDVAAGTKDSITRNFNNPDEKAKLINIFCDGYLWGMSTAMALIEAGILDIKTLEIKAEAKEE